MSEFYVGQRVLYVPYHAHGDQAHPDCEPGVVTSTNDHYIFVRYGDKTGSKATKRDQLVECEP